MYDIKILIFTVMLFISILLVFDSVESCNEAVCASVVSKCMLTQSCKCDLKNCSCCQECFACLSYLYNECCSCVDMCPKPNFTDNALSRKSHVEDFQDPIPDLFNALMVEPDILERWHTFTYPVDFDISVYKPKLEETTIVTHNENQEIASKKNIVTVNCTVAFMSQCMSWNKCKSSCQSTGASKYRWFHDGCCECVGHSCINYGINQSRCRNCPLMKEKSLDDKANFYFDDEDNIDFEVEEKIYKQVQAEVSRVSYSP